MQKYETIFVIDSLLKPDEIDAIISKYEKFISDNGGQIETIERWGKKRLAYEIKKRQYGYYVLIRFDGPGSMIKPLEREYRLNESILRYMTLRLTKQALKALQKQQQITQAQASEPEPKAVEEEEKVAAEEPVAAETTAEPAESEEPGETETTETVASETESEEEKPEPAS